MWYLSPAKIQRVGEWAANFPKDTIQPHATLACPPSLSTERPCFCLFPLSSYAPSLLYCLLATIRGLPGHHFHISFNLLLTGKSFYSNNGHPLSHLKTQKKHFEYVWAALKIFSHYQRDSMIVVCQPLWSSPHMVLLQVTGRHIYSNVQKERGKFAFHKIIKTDSISYFPALNNTLG